MDWQYKEQDIPKEVYTGHSEEYEKIQLPLTEMGKDKAPTIFERKFSLLMT